MTFPIAALTILITIRLANAPVNTVIRGCRVAMMAAMRNVLSPTGCLKSRGVPGGRYRGTKQKRHGQLYQPLKQLPRKEDIPISLTRIMTNDCVRASIYNRTIQSTSILQSEERTYPVEYPQLLELPFCVTPGPSVSVRRYGYVEPPSFFVW
jgi:hypothetical protein